MLIIIVVVSVLFLALALFWIFTTFCRHKIYSISIETIPVEIENSYVKISSSWWSEDLNAEHVDEAYITSSSFVEKIYYATDPIKYEECFKYKIMPEDYKALLNYFINEQQIYSKESAECGTTAGTDEIEVYHSGKLKHIIVSEKTYKMYEEAEKLVQKLVENGVKVTNEK